MDHEVTEFLRSWQGGDEAALEKLTPLVYRELHRLAAKYMRGEQVDHTFEMRNAGAEPLRIRDVKPNCSCTVVGFSQRSGILSAIAIARTSRNTFTTHNTC